MRAKLAVLAMATGLLLGAPATAAAASLVHATTFPATCPHLYVVLWVYDTTDPTHTPFWLDSGSVTQGMFDTYGGPLHLVGQQRFCRA